MSDQACPDRPVRIEGPNLLLVEGRDEVEFFKALLRHMEIQGAQILDVGGKDRFPGAFPAVYLHLDKVRVYAIVRDAEVSAQNTFKSVGGVLRRHGEPFPKRNREFAVKPGIPRKVGVYILPGDADRGMLEDLCLATVGDHPAMPCVKAFMDCLEAVLPRKSVRASSGRGYFPRNPTKARALAFLAAMSDEVHHVGEAAQQGCWNFDHPCLDGLKAFLGAFR